MLINTAGQIGRYRLLLLTLKTGRLGYRGIDVFEQEESILSLSESLR
jgi:lactate dehydrogenase-like 2-hydroxyacid dehydrogenase